MADIPKIWIASSTTKAFTYLRGGIVEHSLDIDWRIMNIVNMDVPARQLFACFAEAMLLEFEQWYTNFSWGRNQNHPRKNGPDWGKPRFDTGSGQFWSLLLKLCWQKFNAVFRILKRQGGRWSNGPPPLFFYRRSGFKDFSAQGSTFWINHSLRH